MKKVAVVILNWNGRMMLEQYLPSVIRYSRDEADIYVADNGSTDGSIAMLSEKFPEVRQITLGENFGFAEGYNRALAQVAAEYYVLLNSDVRVTHHWLTPLVEQMDAHKEVAACQPKLLSMKDNDAFEYAGACGGYLDRLGYPFCRGRLFDTVEADNGQYDYQTDVHWASGAALMVRAKDYQDAGGLDGRFFAHNEEIDLCWRLRIRGKRIVCVPESYVYHLGGGTLPKGNARKTFLNFRNNLTMLYKCLPEEDLAAVMRWRWLLDYLAAWEMLLLGRSWGDFCAVYKARRAFRRWKKDFETDRREIQASRVNNQASYANNQASYLNNQAPYLNNQPPQSAEKEIPERMDFSLLWQYYVKKKKSFASLPLPSEQTDFAD